MLRVGGLGPKKVKALYDQLGVDDLDKLKAACEAGRVAKLKGFGAKTQQKILEGVEFLKQTADRVRIDQAEAVALVPARRPARCARRPPHRGLRQSAAPQGNDQGHRHSRQRRRCRADHGPLRRPAGRGPGARPRRHQVERHHRRRVGRPSLRDPGRLARGQRGAVPLRAALLHRQQGTQHRDAPPRAGARPQAQRVRAGRARRSPCACRDEADLYRALGPGLHPAGDCAKTPARSRPPRRRSLPDLVEAADITGVFHCHTTDSDGADTLEDMAKAAKALGLKYLGLADHSQSLTVANGLSPERVRRQQEAIDALNKRLKGFRLFKGTECDILADGRLDFDDDAAGDLRLRRGQRPQPFQPKPRGNDGPHRPGDPPPGRDDARPRHRPAAAAARGLSGRSGGGVAGGGRERRHGRDQRPPRPARPRLGPLQAGQGARRADRHQPGRPQHRRTWRCIASAWTWPGAAG